MAVTFVVGNAHRISGSLLAPGTTISASIANEFTEAVGQLYTSSLIALGLLLFVLTFIIIAAARLLLLRLEARGAQRMSRAICAAARSPPRWRWAPRVLATADRPGVPGGHSVDAVLARLRRPVLERVHPDHARAGQQRRPHQRDLRQRRHDVAGRAIGAPIGILAATYLSEYGRGKRLSTVIRFINDVLLSAPSIVIGLFVYTLVVLQMGHFSAIAGAISLGIIVIPVTVRTAEDMLRLIPQSMRQARPALGRAALAHDHQHRVSGGPQRTADRRAAGSWRASAARPRRCCSRRSTISSGTRKLNQPMANLPVVIFQFATSPYKNWQSLAWAGALLITLFVLVLSVLARLISNLFGAGEGRIE